MSRRFWIRIRILGWTLIFVWFLIYEVNLLVQLVSDQMVNAVNGLVGAIGTFLVLLGYYILTKGKDP